MESQSLKVFKCPSCGAPLDLKSDASTMKCPYCSGTVVVPESMRASKPASLSDVTRLAKEGKLDEAARIYSKITGLSHENAMFSVKSMAGHRDDEPAASYTSQAGRSYQAPSMPQPVYQPTVRVGGGSCISTVIRLVVFISILGSAIPALLGALQFKLPFDLPFLTGENSILPTPFADEVLKVSTSVLKDPRAIGVDGSGNVLTLNYNDSKVQIFDSQGDNLSEFTATESDGRDLNPDNMVVGSDGTIYIPGFNGILVYNQNGELLRELINKEDLFIIHSISIGPNNVLYAISSDGIIRLNADGSTDLKITQETIEDVSGESPGFGALGVDAYGNIYFSGSINKDVLKFSPTGEFIDSFSGEFDSVRQITFDNYGRIYVVDFFDVKVYDENYNFVAEIDGSFWGVDFDSQNFMYAVTSQGDNILKYQLKAPETQP
jgi:DNA-directed RNA polymerase subunit RPC12/RpoP